MAPRPNRRARPESEAAVMKAKVYFTRAITPEKVVELYNKLGVQLPGKVAVKVHSGEKGNQNYPHPEFWKPKIGRAHV